MKNLVLLCAAMVALTPFVSWAQDEGQPEGDPGARFEQRKQEIELDRQWSELQFHKEMQKIEIEKARQQIKPDAQRPSMGPMGFPMRHPPIKCIMMAMWMVFCAIVNILLAVWVYQDLRRRNSGSGIWIVLVLFTGLFGGVVYAVVRLGDIRAGQTPG